MNPIEGSTTIRMQTSILSGILQINGTTKCKSHLNIYFVILAQLNSHFILLNFMNSKRFIFYLQNSWDVTSRIKHTPLNTYMSMCFCFFFNLSYNLHCNFIAKYITLGRKSHAMPLNLLSRFCGKCHKAVLSCSGTVTIAVCNNCSKHKVAC